MKRIGLLLGATGIVIGAHGCADSVVADGGLELTPIVRIGDAGDGIIDDNVVFAEWVGFYAVSHMSQSDQIQLFDSGGSFVRTIGRPGQGPGEFRSIRAMLPSPDGSLLVVDGGNARISEVSPDFAVATTSRIEWRGRPYTGGYDLLPNGDLLVNGSRPASVGTSYVLRWTGSEVAWTLVEGEELQEDGLRESAVDVDGSIFVVRARHQLRIEHVSAEGEIIATFRPNRPWFDDWREQINEGGNGDGHSGMWGPMAWVHDVEVRGSELWVLGQTGDDRWRRAREGGTLDLGLYTDAVIDVYDKNTGELVRSARFDVPRQLLVRLLSEGRILAYESGSLLNYLVVWSVGEAN